MQRAAAPESYDTRAQADARVPHALHENTTPCTTISQIKTESYGWVLDVWFDARRAVLLQYGLTMYRSCRVGSV
jgi:hypothetical protein